MISLPSGWSLPAILISPAPLNVRSDQHLVSAVLQKSSHKKSPQKPNVSVIHGQAPTSVVPLDALRHLALSTPPGLLTDDFSVAAQWGIYRYFWAFDGPPLMLAAPARKLRFHHRTVLSEHLGIGIGLEVARQYLEELHPASAVRFIDADHARAAGAISAHGTTVKVADLQSNTPDYFALVSVGSMATFYAIEVKGTHRNGHHVQQLADAIRQLSGVAVGGLVPPGLACATVLLDSSGAMSVYAIDPPSEERWVELPEALLTAAAEVRWNREARRLEFDDPAGLVGRLAEAEEDQLLRYATGSVRRERERPPVTALVDDELFVGRRTAIASDERGEGVSVFNGVREDVWQTLDSDPSRRAERFLERRAATERRRVGGDETHAYSIGGDGSLLSVRIGVS